MARNLLLKDIFSEKRVAMRNREMDITVENPGNRKSPASVTANRSRAVGMVNQLVLKVARLYRMIKYTKRMLSNKDVTSSIIKLTVSVIWQISFW